MLPRMFGKSDKGNLARPSEKNHKKKVRASGGWVKGGTGSQGTLKGGNC